MYHVHMPHAIRMRLIILLVLCAGACVVWITPASSKATHSPYLRVHFLDVGQGDAAFIQTQDGVEILIDGGKDGSAVRELARVMDFGDRSIDLVVGTHPDTDHIGGLIDVLESYQVGSILMTENRGESDAASTYFDLAAQEQAQIIYARRGQEFALDARTTLRVLFPETDPAGMESNASSIILQLQHGSSTFLFTGDAPKSIEEYLVLFEGEHLKSDVLKVGHHGSRTSTSELFLEEVRPQYAIISAGKDNSYGHPHLEVTDMLFNKRVQMLETSKEGTITFFSDGESVWVEE